MIPVETCLVCGARARAPWAVLRDTQTDCPTDFTMVRCSDCGLIYLDPRLAIDEMVAHYNYTRFTVDNAAQLPEPESLIDTAKNAHKGALVDRHHAGAPGAILDVGCARGEFLAFMRRRGWEVMGTELAPDFPRTCDVPIRYGTEALSGLIAENRRYDVITLWAVLQHVYEPAALLADCRRLLQPGGLLFVLISNAASPAARWLRNADAPRLLYLFDRHNAARYLERQGFEVVETEFRRTAGIFDSTTRGILVYGYRRLRGMPAPDVIRLYRDRARPDAFWTGDAAGRPSLATRLVNGLDKLTTRILLDPLCVALGYGAVMTLVARTKRA